MSKFWLLVYLDFMKVCVVRWRHLELEREECGAYEAEARADGNDAARRKLAALCGCDPGEVALCGGAQAAWTLARSRCRAAVFDNMMQSND